ncbi:hypothetical protein Hanom_Chr16g01493271 [Helianthus anomalus]
MRGRGPSQLQPSHSHHSKHPQDSSGSHSSHPARHSFSHYSYSHHSHHFHSHTHHDSFHPSRYLSSAHPSQNQLHSDSGPDMQPSGTNQDPIELSNDTASYVGSPYQGPDEWDQNFNQFTFYQNPEHQPQTPPYPPPQTPSAP